MLVTKKKCESKGGNRAKANLPAFMDGITISSARVPTANEWFAFVTVEVAGE